MRTALLAAATGLRLATASVPTSAAIIDGTFTFSASGFLPPGSGVTDPVNGSFSVDFDNSTSIQPLTIGNLSTNLAGYVATNSSFYDKLVDQITLTLLNNAADFPVFTVV